MDKIRYRTEESPYSSPRKAAEVMAYETFEMGNDDILFTLANSLLKLSKLRTECRAFLDELEREGFIDDFSFDDGVAFYQSVLAEIKNVTGVEVEYALWLADKQVVKEFYGGSELDTYAYEIGPVILSELGRDGTLYGYATYPLPIMAKKLNFKRIRW